LRTGQDRTVVSVIHEEINRLTGIEIIEQKANQCTLRTLTQMRSSEFANIMHRVFQMTLDMYRDLVAGACAKDNTMLSTLENKHNSITKFLSFCMRIINTGGISDCEKNHLISIILTLMDKIVDSIKHSGRIARELKPDCGKHATTILEDTLAFFESYQIFHYNYDISKIKDLGALKDKIVKNFHNWHDNLDKKEIFLISMQMNILENTNAMIEYRVAMEY